MSKIIVKPVITEKASDQAEDYRYSFIVDRRANKVEIGKEIERIYGVSVASVNTMNYDGKLKQRFTKAGLVSGRRNNYKKAMITLSEGEINVYEDL